MAALLHLQGAIQIAIPPAPFPIQNFKKGELSRWTCSISKRKWSLHSSQQDFSSKILEGDVIEYDLDDLGNLAVGVVVDIGRESSATLCLEPLTQEDPNSHEWVIDSEKDPVIIPQKKVRLLKSWYMQRMVPDRISNPHGEHAESVWLIEDHS